VPSARSGTAVVLPIGGRERTSITIKSVWGLDEAKGRTWRTRKKGAKEGEKQGTAARVQSKRKIQGGTAKPELKQTKKRDPSWDPKVALSPGVFRDGARKYRSPTKNLQQENSGQPAKSRKMDEPHPAGCTTKLGTWIAVRNKKNEGILETSFGELTSDKKEKK